MRKGRYSQNPIIWSLVKTACWPEKRSYTSCKPSNNCGQLQIPLWVPFTKFPFLQFFNAFPRAMHSKNVLAEWSWTEVSERKGKNKKRVSANWNKVGTNYWKLLPLIKWSCQQFSCSFTVLVGNVTRVSEWAVSVSKKEKSDPCPRPPY